MLGCQLFSVKWIVIIHHLLFHVFSVFLLILLLLIVEKCEECFIISTVSPRLKLSHEIIKIPKSLIKKQIELHNKQSFPFITSFRFDNNIFGFFSFIQKLISLYNQCRFIRWLFNFFHFSLFAKRLESCSA